MAENTYENNTEKALLRPEDSLAKKMKIFKKGKNVGYTLDYVAAKVESMGVVPAINNMLGTNITCDEDVLLCGKKDGNGDFMVEKPIDDKLLIKIGREVALAAKDGRITRAEAEAIMAPAYEWHYKIDPERFDSVIEKGRRLAYEMLSDEETRAKVDKFIDIWGNSFYGDTDSEKAREAIEKRREAAALFSDELMPKFCKLCGVNPKIAVDTMEKNIDAVASANLDSIRFGKPHLSVVLYLDDTNNLARSAVDIISTSMHELFHCLQYKEYSDAYAKVNSKYSLKSDKWCTDDKGVIPERALWVMLVTNGKDFSYDADVNNPDEQEAYSVGETFAYVLRDYLTAETADGKRKIPTKPFSEEQKAIILRNTQNKLIGI